MAKNTVKEASPVRAGYLVGGAEVAPYRANVFVIGDLVIDHTVFVTPPEHRHPEPVSGEDAWSVLHRLDTAGGAATAARTINMLSDGTTFLWGLIGSSPWGTFRSILDNSQSLDGATHRIEFRGVRDETDAPMTTVSRLVLVHDGPGRTERYERKARFMDVGQVHVPQEKRDAVMYHLERAQQTRAPFNAVVLDDLDLGTLRQDIIDKIAHFAASANIPLFLRVRHDAAKYEATHARAIVCTLGEWVQLVKTDRGIDFWKANIRTASVAYEFASRSLFAFPNVDYHAVLVGDDWIDFFILIERGTGPGEPCRVMTLSGLPEREKGRSHQVGTSDVFTGALALEFCAAAGGKRSLESAVTRATLAAARYQTMSWHRVPPMPALVEVRADPPNVLRHRAIGTPFLPRTDIIEMSDAQTDIPEMLSVTPALRRTLKEIVSDADGGWDDAHPMVLVATGGSGKSVVGKFLMERARSMHPKVWHAITPESAGFSWDWGRPDRMIEHIRKAKTRFGVKKCFVMLDEALKAKGATTVASNGVVLLNKAKSEGIRFLFIDADFEKPAFQGLRSQFRRRCSWHRLPSAWERAWDIPYITAAGLRRGTASERHGQISIEASALASIIEWIVEERHNFGDLDNVCRSVMQAKGTAGALTLHWVDLPEIIRRGSARLERWRPETYDVRFV